MIPRLIEIIPKINNGLCPAEKTIPIKEIKRINSLGSKITLLVLQTAAVLKQIKSRYPVPKAKATGTGKGSWG
jgi:hypothetical protein